MEQEKKSFGGQKGKNKPLDPKNGIWGPKSYGRVIYPSIWNFVWSKKKFTFGGQKGENLRARKRNLGPKTSMVV
jgi:hypothetical protein